MITIPDSFELQNEAEVAEVNAHAYRLRHKKSGADLLFLENSDENKVFGVGFRTPQETSNGVPHIIEHCVLSGSRKYKTKEPFMNLLQSSLATFLNAMTYPDHTIYPVASRNEQDFHNLMDVYLDAVFYPNIYQDERIFRQEGWRYQLPSAEADLGYSGVVYNEMRGAFSSPTQIAYSEINRNLFPDTQYAYVSGGEPYTIPTLSYEEFLDFHRRYYHPTNARIYLYGNINIAETLEYLDSEYLGNFTYQEPNSELRTQEKFLEPRYAQSEYSLSVGEDVEGKDILIWAVACNTYSDILENFRLDVLENALFSSQSAPVRLALQEAGLSDDMMSFTDQKKQNSLQMILLNAKPEAKEQYRAIIETTLAKVVEEGIDRELLTASLNKLEYALREGNGYTTLGILYFQKAFEVWNYDGDPIVALEYEKPLSRLREELTSNVWETFVSENLLHNPHKALIQIQAVAGLNDRKDKEVAKSLQEYKATLSAEQIAELVDKNRQMEVWQLTEDTEEAKATIPHLSIQDIETKLADPPCLVSEIGKDTILEHPIFTSGIQYACYSFPLEHIASEDLFYVALLSLLQGSVATSELSYADLNTKVHLATGGITISPLVAVREADSKLLFRMNANVKALDKEGKIWPELLRQILLESSFADDRRILEILKMDLVSKEQEITQSGDKFARNRLMASYNQEAEFQEVLTGITYYLRLKDLVTNFDQEKDELRAKLLQLQKEIYTRGQMVLSLLAATEDLPQWKETVVQSLAFFPEKEKTPVERIFEPQDRNEGFQVSSNVQYVVKGYDFERLGAKFDSKMAVLSGYLAKSYLHNTIRAQGGAYGANLTVSRNGALLASSYRDPNLQRSLASYDALPAWLREQQLTEEDTEQLIIGSINRFDPPLNPRAQGALAFRRYLTGYTTELAEKELANALTTTAADLKKYAELIEQAMQQDRICVVGNSQVLEDAKELFDVLIKI